MRHSVVAVLAPPQIVPTSDGTRTEANLQSCMSAPVSCGVDATDPTPMKAKSPLYRDVITIGK